MTPERKTETSGTKSPVPSPGSPAAARKAWKPKTPLEVMLDQIQKQEDKVAGIKEHLAHEEKSLSKLLQVKKLLES